uniref:Heat shock protein 70 n=1 Tax=Panagrolaimus davidi TaxID=227884 RepID=A0A914QDD2_9BILA
MLPTYVTFDERNEKFGEIAINRMRENSIFTVFDIKRILGNIFEDIQIDKMWPFKLNKLQNQVFVEVETFEGRKLLKPEEIASTFFKHIKIKVDEFQNKNLTEAVITIPASYNETQKQSIIKAAKLGGWKIIYLLPEPIAAAFAYCDEAALEINLNLLVFDLGGGTLDIFIVKTAKCMLNFLSSNGSLFLGGRDFDTILIKYFEKILYQKYGTEIMKNESKKYKFMADCQEAKNTLSYEMEAS